ncbi:MAG: transglycosylase domain-containing protein [Fimbriimonas ginsengisoli]|uniref:Transglycosylase domain-containing protein n=1 Tax=Fimbriimonas ginsengisoli TaxID=1005039 RepID=A0A931PVD7_FIMGI|nr:transglycosylase domain-containing protein [Fimbriimonas ginsengisoli]
MRKLKITLAVISLVLVVACLAGGLYFLSAVNEARAELPKIDAAAGQLSAPPTEILAADGTPLYRVSGELREYVPLAEIPKVVQNAMIAAEDRRFYDHRGVDYKAILRTVFVNTRDWKVAQGGSTLTMQLAKQLSSKGERTFGRKVHDMALATAMESGGMTKQRILELYLNQVYFGGHAYGVKAAAEVFFGKQLAKLTVSEAAFLARLVRRPSNWKDLYRNQKLLQAATDNRNVVLGIMLGDKMIDQAQYDRAIAEEPALNKRPPKSSARILMAPYFVTHVLDLVRRELPDIDLKAGGYKIETTLDPALQQLAEREVRRVVALYRRRKVTTAAFVMMNSEGQILAEVGGAEFEKNQYNMVYQGRRQPGSSFKPFMYATALAAGVVHMDDYISNERITFPAPPGGEAYSPQNSNSKYGGDLPLRLAFAISVNIPAVRTIAKVGPRKVVETAHEAFGFVSPLDPVLPLALGASAVNPLEMAQGYSVFMLRGDRATPYAIKRVLNPDGEVIKEYGPNIKRNVMDAHVCEEIDQLMRGVIEYGTGTRAKIVPNARGKTGTTSENRDAWFCGYSDGLLGIGWIANERRPDPNGPPVYDPMESTVFGGNVTVQFWASVMKAAHDKYGTRFATSIKPSTGVNVAPAPALAPDQAGQPVNGKSKMGPVGGDDASDADLPSTAPDDKVPPKTAPDQPPTPPPEPVIQYVEAEVCADSGMLATPYCPETVVRRFRKGEEPKGVCPIHKG